MVSDSLIKAGKTLSIFETEDYQQTALQIFGVTVARAQDQTIGGCIAEAVGIITISEAATKGLAGLGKKGVFKIIRKVAAKALGPLGGAIAAYDFAVCMKWIPKSKFF